MSENKQLFLSAVSDEFRPFRALLASDLKRPDLAIATQEDFIVTGGSTLEKLDTYLRHCDAVIHLVGKAAGALPPEPAVAALLARYPDLADRLTPLADRLRLPQPGFSYTQWEAYLAIYHRRPLFVYRPTDFDLDILDVPRDPKFVYDPADAQAQQEHYARIRKLGHDRGQFRNEERLSSAVLRDLVEILPRLESNTPVSPTRLQHAAERLVGRELDLTRLDDAWNNPARNVVVVRAFGGMGKTSLVATWMAELALKNWRGAERVFDWSFYSQGTRDHTAASAETFIAEALKTFGDPDPNQGSAWDRGARLAHLIGDQRCLLVLDGLEPLQHAPGPMAGKLKDPGVEALLKGLVARNAGLCVVTTREKVDDIKQHYGRSADDFELTRLTDLAGASLLHFAGAKRAGAKSIEPDDLELQVASREVDGHGLTLQLLGQFLGLAEDGDIRKRDTVRLEDAEHEYQNDATRPYGHAFKAMEAYEKWFEGEGDFGHRQLAILRLLGLFDRPASRDCLDALRSSPPIRHLTEPLFAVKNRMFGFKRIYEQISDRDWKLILHRLEGIGLIVLPTNGLIDSHPLLREYFARQLRTKQPKTWRTAHRRLYEHLCATTKEGDQPTLEDLQPLYQAVAHGCQAGWLRTAEACEKIYVERILRGAGAGNGYYSTKTLGAIGADLGAIACFFEKPWSRVSPLISVFRKSWLLNEAAFRLLSLGRLTEALEPMQAGPPIELKRKDWSNAAISTSNLSELELRLGQVASAVTTARLAVTYADRSGEEFHRIASRTALADALHQSGSEEDAAALFRDAEQMQFKFQPGFPRLASMQGFNYCDLLLTGAERATWNATLDNGSLTRFPRVSGVSDHTRRDAPHQSGAEPLHSKTLREQSCRTGGRLSSGSVRSQYSKSIRNVAERAAKSLRFAKRARILADIAFHSLTLTRATFFGAILSGSSPVTCQSSLDKSVSDLRAAGHIVNLPLGLLTRAWFRRLNGTATGPDSAQADLDEAWEIAERGPMPLFLADIHLHRARLFFRVDPYPWASPQHDLAEARRLIEKHGYGRRLPELENAEKFLRTR